MALAPNPENYMLGKGEVFFAKQGGSGLLHVGNVPSLSLSISEETLDHYSSMGGINKKDLSITTQVNATLSMTLEEFTPENLAMAFKGGDPASAGQTASTIDGTAVTLSPGAFVALSAHSISYVSLSVAQGSTALAVGDEIAGQTSSATATVRFVDGDNLLVTNVTGTFVSGETVEDTGGSGTAVVSGVAVVPGVIALDDTKTTLYKAGTDYDINTTAGLLRARVDGAMGSTCTIYADTAPSSGHVINALTGGDTTGHLLYVGNPPYGPKTVVNCWRVKLSVNGELGLIGEQIAQIPIQGEILADETNHPTAPYFSMETRNA